MKSGKHRKKTSIITRRKEKAQTWPWLVDKGAVIEIDPVSRSIISIIGKQRDPVERDSFLGCNSRC